MDRSDSPAPHPGASPLKAFVIILALIILTTAIFLLAANGEESPNATPTESDSPPDFSLTDEEALARFEELKGALVEGIRQRDPTLVSAVTTTDGPTRPRILEEISRLQDQGVIDSGAVETVSLSIIERGPESIVLTESVHLRPCFRTESGEDITDADSLVLQVGEWTMEFDGTKWLLHDAVLKKEKVLDDRDAHCD
jgi:hypothetical protein